MSDLDLIRRARPQNIVESMRSSASAFARLGDQQDRLFAAVAPGVLPVLAVDRFSILRRAVNR